MAKRASVRKPYKKFYGEEHTVTGVRGRGLHRVKLLSRANIKGETVTDYRYVFCKVLTTIRGDIDETGNTYLISIKHNTKEVGKRLLLQSKIAEQLKP